VAEVRDPSSSVPEGGAVVVEVEAVGYGRHASGSPSSDITVARPTPDAAICYWLS
jgi:hypothetical protein